MMRPSQSGSQSPKSPARFMSRCAGAIGKIAPLTFRITIVRRKIRHREALIKGENESDPEIVAPPPGFSGGRHPGAIPILSPC
jgi:hypothetical protein